MQAGTERRGRAQTAGALDRLVAGLAGLLGPERVSVAGAHREQHGGGESYHELAPPDVVVWPHTTAEVSAVVERVAAAGCPIVPFGAGTSLEGHVAALEGGVCVDLSRMTNVVRVSVEDMDATVEAGVTRLQLDRRLRPEGVFFPVDPGADATIGGMVATGASGTTTVRYGAMRENVLALTAVTADGSVVRTASRARKSAAGYDLTGLLVGSEGTLAIVTEAVLRLHPTPESIAAAVCSFGALEEAVDYAVQLMQVGVPVARLELLDDLAIAAVNRRSGLDLPTEPTLFVEFHGSSADVTEQGATARELAVDASRFEWTSDTSERQRLWEARHQAYEASLALRPGARALTTDVCVPVANLARCIRETRADVDACGLTAPLVGHVGDGNFHLFVLVDGVDELAEAQALGARLAERSIALDGTCTGEHGVGYGKAGFLPLEHGWEGVRLMAAIKQALDPCGILNPGKLLPAAGGPAT